MSVPLDYWKVDGNDYVIVVTEQVARSVVAMYEAGDEVLHFNDLFDAETFLPRKDFHGVYHSSLKTRTAYDDLRKALKDEENENKTWG